MKLENRKVGSSSCFYVWNKGQILDTKYFQGSLLWNSFVFFVPNSDPLIRMLE